MPQTNIDLFTELLLDPEIVEGADDGIVYYEFLTSIPSYYYDGQGGYSYEKAVGVDASGNPIYQTIPGITVNYGGITVTVY